MRATIIVGAALCELYQCLSQSNGQRTHRSKRKYKRHIPYQRVNPGEVHLVARRRNDDRDRVYQRHEGICGRRLDDQVTYIAERSVSFCRACGTALGDGINAVGDEDGGEEG